MQLNDKLYSGFLIFIINVGSLKSERIDSTETTISRRHAVSSFRSKYVLFLTEKAFPSCLWATSQVFFFHKFHP